MFYLIVMKCLYEKKVLQVLDYTKEGCQSYRMSMKVTWT
jgi:hypothetical protein